MINKLAITPEDVQSMYEEDQEYQLRKFKAQAKEGFGLSIKDGLRFGFGFAISTTGFVIGFTIVLLIIGAGAAGS